MMIDVSVIIVSYNTKNKIMECIRSVIDHTNEVCYEIIVSDNGSSDGSVEEIKRKFPDVVLIENNCNLGFGRANNRGLDAARGKYIFYLNSDTRIENDAIDQFVRFWRNNGKREKIGALGAQLLDNNHNLTHSGASFPSYKHFCLSQARGNLICLAKYLIKKIKLDGLYIDKVLKPRRKQPGKSQIGEIDYITGADLFLKNNDNARFNEEYFMYCEETELEVILAKKGLKRIIIDGPRIIHDQEKAHESSILVYRKTDYYKEQSSIIYSKNNLNTNAFLLKILINLNGLNPGVREIRNKIKQETYRVD